MATPTLTPTLTLTRARIPAPGRMMSAPGRMVMCPGQDRAGAAGVSEPDTAAGGTTAAPPQQTRPPKVRTRPATSMLDGSILRRALGEAFVKLDPRAMVRIPVMFVVEIGSVITAIEFFASPSLFVGLISLWLWATVLFANFAEAVAEGRGKAQADTLRRSRQETMAFVRRAGGTLDEIPSAQLQVGDLCVVAAGQVIPGDGDVVEGLATVDESAITGESAPVIRESGGDRSRGDRRHRGPVRPDRGPRSRPTQVRRSWTA